MSQTLTYDLTKSGLEEGEHTLYARGKYITDMSNEVSWSWGDFTGLTFTANTEGSTVTLDKNNSPSWTGYYSINNGGTWTEYIPGTTGAIILNNAGDSVCFKGTYSTAPDYSNSLKFSMSGSISGSGNIMSMCSGDDFTNVTTIPYDYCFYGLFKDCNSLTSSPSLPATTLANDCYFYMFYGCTSLTTPPSLPATELSQGCYCEMFMSCTSLISAPSLSSTSLQSSCYQGMFCECTSLKSAPTLPSTTISYNGYNSMFSGCTSLTTPPELPATSLDEYCYCGMFEGCTSLVSTPKLSATVLPKGCYSSMFKGCTSLKTAASFSMTKGNSQCCYSMFANCTSLISVPTLPTPSGYVCYYYMFGGCSSLKVSNSSGTKFLSCPSSLNNYETQSMFSGTGGTFTGTPVANGTYYYY